MSSVPSKRVKRECGAGHLALFRSCPRNCKRPFSIQTATGHVREGGSGDDREPGDRPMTGNQLVRRWVDGRGVMGLLKYAAGSAAIVTLACCHSAARAQSNSGQLPPVVVNPESPPKPVRQIRRDRDRRASGPGGPGAPPAASAPPSPPPEVVVTADREPEPISRTGSSISVVKG